MCEFIYNILQNWSIQYSCFTYESHGETFPPINTNMVEKYS